LSPDLLDPHFLQLLSTLSLKLKSLRLGSSKKTQPRRGTSIDFGGYRSYTPGEDLRYVDWNVYGRLEQYFLKEFESEEFFKVVLYLDCSLSMDYGQPSKFFFAKKIAALLGYLTLSEGHHLALKSSRNPESLFSGSKQLFTFLQHLQALTPQTTAFDPISSLSEHKGQSLGVVLSDWYHLPLATYCKLLKRNHHQTLAFHILDPQEYVLSSLGFFHFRDKETQKTLKLPFTSLLQKAYREKFEHHLKHCEQECRSLGLHYLRLETTTPFDLVLGLQLLKTGVFQ
jgi:uncharacterized protein (DUF58 family)